LFGRIQYFFWPHFKFEQLFDIKNDPGELIDLANSINISHTLKLGEMRKRFNELKIIVHSDAAVIM
jgi:hypothetical protein